MRSNNTTNIATHFQKKHAHEYDVIKREMENRKKRKPNYTLDNFAKSSQNDNPSPSSNSASNSNLKSLKCEKLMKQQSADMYTSLIYENSKREVKDETLR